MSRVAAQGTAQRNVARAFSDLARVRGQGCQFFTIAQLANGARTGPDPTRILRHEVFENGHIECLRANETSRSLSRYQTRDAATTASTGSPESQRYRVVSLVSEARPAGLSGENQPALGLEWEPPRPRRVRGREHLTQRTREEWCGLGTNGETRGTLSEPRQQRSRRRPSSMPHSSLNGGGLHGLRRVQPFRHP